MLRDLVQTFPLVTLFITGITILMILYKRDRRVKELMNKFPGPPSYPFIGAALEFNLSNEEMTKLQFKYANLYGPRYALQIGTIFYLSLANGEDVEKLLSSTIHINKGEMYELLKPWLKEGLLTSQGRKWQARRKMLTPTFHFKILDDFMPIFNEQANVLVDVLRNDFSGGQVRDMFPYVTRCALDVICETAMGKKLNSQREHDTPYVKAVYKMCEFIQYRLVRPWLKWEVVWRLTPQGREEGRCLKILHEFTERVIRERKKETLEIIKEHQDNIQLNRASQVTNEETGPHGQNGNEDDTYWKGKRRLAFLDLLVEAQKNPENRLKDSDLREEVDTFMFEGHDTTAASINWTLFLLGAYREHQFKVHEELDEIFGSDKTRPITTQDLTQMKYLELCIKESLRLYPSVPLIARHLTTDCVLDDGAIIPAGANVFIMTTQVHRNAKVYPEPELFSPDRFLPENCVGRHPFSYIPFSAGPRNCIGQKFAQMEEKVILANVLRHFTVEATQRPEDVIVMSEVITRPKDGLPVKFIPRL